MAEYFIREAIDNDIIARKSIIESTTRELRKIYTPRGDVNLSKTLPTGTLVAMKQNTVLGTAEYVIKETNVYLQGIAVHPNHHKQGICRSLIVAAEEIARKAKLNSITVSVIEETGNVAIFKKIGFSIISRAVAQAYINPVGGGVTLVEMERKFS